MKTRADSIRAIWEVMTKPIPDRPKRRAKLQKSWQQLEQGREIEATLPLLVRRFGEYDEDHLPPGSLFLVTKADSQGVDLWHAPSRSGYRLEDKLWTEKFKKVRKGRKKAK